MSRCSGTPAASSRSRIVRRLAIPSAALGCAPSRSCDAVEDLGPAPALLDEVEHLPRLVLREQRGPPRRLPSASPGSPLRSSPSTFSRPILASLSSARSTGPVLSATPRVSSRPSRILRLFSVIVNVGHAGGGERVVDDLRRLGVGHDALGPDRVEVALDELAEPALRRPLAAEDRADRVPLERDAQLIDVLGDEPGQRHGQVEPQGELAGRAPLVRDVEDLPQDLVGPGPLAGQDLHPLDVRGLDRHVAERGERPAEAGEHPLAGDHHRGGDVPQPAGHAGIDHRIGASARGMHATSVAVEERSAASAVSPCECGGNKQPGERKSPP